MEALSAHSSLNYISRDDDANYRWLLFPLERALMNVNEQKKGDSIRYDVVIT